MARRLGELQMPDDGRSRLGRGLAALIGDVGEETKAAERVRGQRRVSVEVSDREALELAIVENIQRTDLNAMEEAEGYRALIDEFGHSHDDVAKIVGKSRAHVTNTLRLLKLSLQVQQYVRSGKLTAG